MQAPTDTPSVLHKEKPRLIRAVVFVVVGLIAFILALKFKQIFGDWASIVEHSVTTLAVIAVVHLLDRVWLFADVREELELITGRIDDQISGLTAASLSLQAMNQGGIVRLYTDRSTADEDIFNDLVASDVRNIRLIGISLNDFVRGHTNKPLYRAWLSIEKHIATVRHDKEIMDIKILIIDPGCMDAELRSKAEHVDGDSPPDRLEDDVTTAAKRLHALMEQARSNPTVKFECKMYRLVPQSFVVRTDNACYVQPYHFWHRRHDATPIPVLRYRRVKQSAEPRVYDMHAEMQNHFEWIWQWASIPVADFLLNHGVGCDKAMYRCGAVNVYTDSETAWNRIVYLIRDAKERIDIQGITLHSFFRRESIIVPDHPFRRLLEQDKVTIRLLLLDHDYDSEQARYRSYREYLLTNPHKDVSAYTREEHQESRLFRDAEETISAIKIMVAEIAKTKPVGWKPLISLRKYKSAPVAFVLQIDKTLVIEQYQYGKPVITRAILSRDMPVMEFTDVTEPNLPRLIEPALDRSPYHLFRDHFDFAWNTATDVPLLLGHPTTPTALE